MGFKNNPSKLKETEVAMVYLRLETPINSGITLNPKP